MIMAAVYKVYWTDKGCPQSENFNANEMSEALKFCERLRAVKEEDGTTSYSFITLVAEDPNCVSNGVAAPNSDYSWEKRRGGRK